MNKSKTFVLVVGGMGYIGSNVVVEAIENGYDVIISDNLINSNLDILDQIKLIVDNNNFENKLVYEHVDFCDINQVDQLFCKYRITIVINLAGYKSVPESIENPSMYYRNNINIVTNLLHIMKKYQCYKFIFSSSATVYGEFNSIPYTESQSIGSGITNPYGFTKVIIEQMLSNMCQFDHNWSIISLRYFNPIGCHSSGYLGDNIEKPTNLMPVILKSIIDKTKFKIYGSDYQTKDGSAERDYIHVTDLAKAHILIIPKMNNGYHYYNVGTGIPISVFDIVKRFEIVNNIELNYEIVNRRSGDLTSYYADNSKIKNEIGWSPSKSLDDMVEDSYKYLQNILKI